MKNVADLVRHREADRVGQIHRGAAGGDDGFDHAAEKIHVAARRILGRELHVVGVLTRLANRGHRRLEAPLLRHAELALEVQVGGRDERVDAAARRRRERPAGAVDVGGMAARERGDHRALNGGRDQTHGLGIGFRGDREAGFDNVDTERRQLLRHLQLFIDAQGKAGRLLAIAKRGVEDSQPVGRRHGWWHLLPCNLGPHLLSNLYLFRLNNARL